MKTNRIEAFSDGVIAILITIMVLELKAPHDPTPASLVQMWPTFFAYVLSFIIIAIYWVNHHHLIHLVTRVDSVVLWANINLLFWISLIPWVTVYLGEITRCHFRSRFTPPSRLPGPLLFPSCARRSPVIITNRTSSG